MLEGKGEDGFTADKIKLKSYEKRKDGNSLLKERNIHTGLIMLLELTNRASTHSRHSWQNLKLVLVSLLAPPMVITVLFPSASILTTVVVPRLSVSGISSFCLREALAAAQ